MAELTKLLAASGAGGPTVLWDGAVGTQLLARGLSAKVPELLNLSKPEALTAIHADYLRAGSAVVQTNTFGANRVKLALAGEADKFEAINASAVAAARAAVAEVGRGLVAGDLGPTGQMIEPHGPLSIGEAQDVYAEQAKILAAAGADLISIETMFDLEETRAAIRGAHRACDLPVVAQMTFRRTGRGFFTMMGVTPEQAVMGLLEAGAIMVGANCTITIEDMIPLIKEMRKATEAPLIAQPNAGDPELVDGQPHYQVTADNFAARSPELRAAGATAIGACCGSAPAFIAAIRERLA